MHRKEEFDLLMHWWLAEGCEMFRKDVDWYHYPKKVTFVFYANYDYCPKPHVYSGNSFYEAVKYLYSIRDKWTKEKFEEQRAVDRLIDKCDNTGNI